MYADFDLVIPETLDAALAALAEGNGETRALAGGTNMIVDLRARRAKPARLVGLGKLEALAGRQDSAASHLDEAVALAREVKRPTTVLLAAAYRALLRGGDVTVALEALEEHGSGAMHTEKMEARFALWKATQDAEPGAWVGEVRRANRDGGCAREQKLQRVIRADNTPEPNDRHGNRLSSIPYAIHGERTNRRATQPAGHRPQPRAPRDRIDAHPGKRVPNREGAGPGALRGLGDRNKIRDIRAELGNHRLPGVARGCLDHGCRRLRILRHHQGRGTGGVGNGNVLSWSYSLAPRPSPLMLLITWCCRGWLHPRAAERSLAAETTARAALARSLWSWAAGMLAPAMRWSPRWRAPPA